MYPATQAFPTSKLGFKQTLEANPVREIFSRPTYPLPNPSH